MGIDQPTAKGAIVIEVHIGSETTLRIVHPIPPEAMRTAFTRHAKVSEQIVLAAKEAMEAHPYGDDKGCPRCRPVIPSQGAR